MKPDININIYSQNRARNSNTQAQRFLKYLKNFFKIYKTLLNIFVHFN